MTPGMPVSCLSGEPLSVGAVFHWVVTLIWYGLPPGGFEDGVASLSVPPLFGGFYAVLTCFSSGTRRSTCHQSCGLSIGLAKVVDSIIPSSHAHELAAEAEAQAQTAADAEPEPTASRKTTSAREHWARRIPCRCRDGRGERRVGRGSDGC